MTDVPNVYPPDDNECKFYADKGWSGQSFSWRAPTNYGEKWVKWLTDDDVDFNNRMESYMCGKHVMVEFCNDTPYAPPYGDEWDEKCSNKHGQSAVGAVWNTEMVYGKGISSIRL